LKRTPRPPHLKPVYSRNPHYNEPVTFEHTFPDDFILLVDTREQDPLFKKPPKDLLVKRTTLPAGDYSVDGWECSITIERKSIPDLFGSLGTGRERFQHELERLCSFEWKALVIEGQEDDVLRWQEFSQMHPNSIRWSLVAIQHKYCPGMHIYYGSRHNIERYILDNLVYFQRRKREQALL
jgi:DNA excision repair protein ERCC-4